MKLLAENFKRNLKINFNLRELRLFIILTLILWTHKIFWIFGTHFWYRIKNPGRLVLVSSYINYFPLAHEQPTLPNGPLGKLANMLQNMHNNTLKCLRFCMHIFYACNMHMCSIWEATDNKTSSWLLEDSGRRIKATIIRLTSMTFNNISEPGLTFFHLSADFQTSLHQKYANFYVRKSSTNSWISKAAKCLCKPNMIAVIRTLIK